MISNSIRIHWLRFLLVSVILAGALIIGLANGAQATPTDENLTINLPEYQEPQVQEPPGVGGLLFKILVSVLVIVILSYGLIRLFGKGLKLQGGTWISILDHVSLGPNRGIYLVDIGGKVLVLGMTDHNMVKIMEIEDDAIIAEMRLDQSSFDDSTLRKWKRRINRFGSSSNNHTSIDPQNQLKQRLNFHATIEEQLKRMQGLYKDDRHE
ncbi:MAG: FliO/MopB family protein [Syntrophomonadaceae bacterium]|nr:FliO/MopB family protein [Syntrophomonadaceae bacterium]